MATETHPFTHLGAAASTAREVKAPSAESPSAVSLLRELLTQLTILMRQELDEIARMLGFD